MRNGLGALCRARSNSGSSLAKGSSDMRAAIELVRAQLGKLRGEVSSSAAFWGGSAAGAFTVLMGEFDGKANKLQMILDTIANLVDKSAANHQQNEEEQKSNANNLLGILHGG